MPIILNELVVRDATGPAGPQDQNLSQDALEALQRIQTWGPYGYQPHLASAIVFCIGASPSSLLLIELDH